MSVRLLVSQLLVQFHINYKFLHARGEKENSIHERKKRK